MFQGMKLAVKVPMFMIALVVVTILSIVVVQTFMARSAFEHEAKIASQEIAYRYASDVEGYLENGMDTALVMAKTIEQGLKANANQDKMNIKNFSGGVTVIPAKDTQLKQPAIEAPAKLTRAMVMSMLLKILEENPGFQGTWCAFEPGAFGDNDADYASAPGHDAKGRFVPYYTRGSGQITLQPCATFSNEWYTYPFSTGQPLITEPYEFDSGGKRAVATSISIPIKDPSGKVVGVCGLDFELVEISDRIQQIKPFGDGWASLSSPQGKFTGHPDASYLNQDMTEEEFGASEVRTEMRSAVAQGNMFQGTEYVERTGQQVMITGVPIQVGQSVGQWLMTIYVPTSTVMEEANTMSLLTIGLALLVLLIAAPLVFLFARSFIKPFVHSADQICRVAQAGEIAEDVDQKFLNRKDEIGDLTRAVQSMLEFSRNLVSNVRTMADGDWNTDVPVRSTEDDLGVAMRDMNSQINQAISEVAATVNQVAAGASELTHASLSLSEGATDQASSLRDISNSMSDIETRTRANADYALEANKIALTASEVVTSGQQCMEMMLEAMKRINETGVNTQRIANNIDSIASETNLLALNAAVEAARAGQHGRGFAVVADEVGKLATLSAKAARETTDLINDSNEQIQKGMTICEDAAQALDRINESVSKTSELVGEIATASQSQASGIAEVNNGLGQIDSVTQQTASAAEQSAAAAEEMSTQAEMLTEIVGRFKLKPVGV